MTHFVSNQTHLVPDNWYETFFTTPINSFWESVMPPEATCLEADFIERRLNLQPGHRLLDVPCGTGRHSLELAGRGYRVTGIDISLDAVARLRARAGELPLDIVHRDMSQLQFESEFDGAICMGNSFGYLQHDGMQSFLRGIRNALRPGARLLVDTGMTAESILRSAQNDATYELGGYTFEIRNDYDLERSRLLSHTVLKKGAEEWRQCFSHAVYTCGELGRMFDAAGLCVLERWSSIDATPYKLGDPRLLLIAERL